MAVDTELQLFTQGVHVRPPVVIHDTLGTSSGAGGVVHADDLIFVIHVGDHGFRGAGGQEFFIFHAVKGSVFTDIANVDKGMHLGDLFDQRYQHF